MWDKNTSATARLCIKSAEGAYARGGVFAGHYNRQKGGRGEGGVMSSEYIRNFIFGPVDEIYTEPMIYVHSDRYYIGNVSEVAIVR